MNHLNQNDLPEQNTSNSQPQPASEPADVTQPPVSGPAPASNTETQPPVAPQPSQPPQQPPVAPQPSQPPQQPSVAPQPPQPPQNCPPQGNPVYQQPTYQQPPYQPSPYQQPPYQPPAGWQPYQQPTGFYPPQKRKTPGKGFAITSMIMGIFALLYSFEQIGGLLGLLLYPLQPFYDYSSGATALANALSGLSGGAIFVTLALVFGVVARSKGYQRDMSTAGLILGGIAGGIYVLSILLSIVVATML